MYKILMAAGLGGTLPTLCRLAASYNALPTQPKPALGVYLALIVFFVIGMAVAFGFQEPKIQKAFTLGIAAPGIVTSIFSGASPSQVQPTQQTVSGTTAQGKTGALTSPLRLLGIGDAYAQTSVPASGKSGSAAAGAPPEKQLIVQPSDTGHWTNSGPVELKFIEKNGAPINQLAVSSQVASTVIVPPGAAAVEATTAGKTTVAALPSAGYTSAVLTLHVKAEAGNDFLWALGAPRSATVSGISGKISDVRAPPPAAPNTSSNRPAPTTQLGTNGSRKDEASACADANGSAGRTGGGCPSKQAPPQ